MYYVLEPQQEVQQCKADHRDYVIKQREDQLQRESELRRENDQTRQAYVTAEKLLADGVLSKCEYGLKILGNGQLEKKLTVQASAFSESAKEKIEAAGGKAEVV